MCDNCIEKTIQEKWLPIYNGEESKSCACCAEHRNCLGCPIRKYTGFMACVQTPYNVYQSTYADFRLFQMKSACESTIAFDAMMLVKDAAMMEIEFLREVQKAQTNKQ